MSLYSAILLFIVGVLLLLCVFYKEILEFVAYFYNNFYYKLIKSLFEKNIEKHCIRARVYRVIKLEKIKVWQEILKFCHPFRRLQNVKA
jgi:hypothetical protein